MVSIEPLKDGPAGATKLAGADIKGKLLVEQQWNITGQETYFTQ